MCGIFGYLGSRPLLETLLSGLRRLEYRGYDSSGIGYVEGGALRILREKGKIASLAEVADSVQTKATAGISHTRWATHGVPEKRNAHPHLSFDGKIAVTHNGIIENYRELKERLQKAGVAFQSETDTEVIAHLIAKNYQGDLYKAVAATLPLLEGAYGLAILAADEPDLIVGARKGSPLVIGVGEGEMILSSDTAAIVPFTKNVVYMNDGELVTLRRDHYQLTSLHAGPRKAEVSSLSFDVGMIEKKGFEHFMLKEIFEQAETVANAYRGRILPDEGNVKLGGLNFTAADAKAVRRAVIVACGTSWHAALVGEYLLENLAGLPVEVDYASEYTSRNCILEDGTLFLAISQSGETADTLSALREARTKGAKTHGIVNVVGSTIARETDGGIYLHAGPEIGVASTKAFTSQVTALVLLAVYFGRLRLLPSEDARRILTALTKIPEQIQHILERAQTLKDMAARYLDGHHALYLGRSYNFPVALEGALKLKEISYIHAEGYPAAEMKHGPIALIDENMPVIVVATKGDTYAKVLSNIQEVRARKGRVIAIATEGDKDIAAASDEVFYVPETLPMLAPILNVIPLQLLAYYAAVARGCDVDQPRNLAKSVTVE
ncbi:MAG: glutamine--fructose-6-phosphate transaminase (isomerizing) [Spirochaetes bacterium]|nr:glutamine--fructose-6-phosphate transaminase (isomerizing) [Spirochaetota bacterium]